MCREGEIEMPKVSVAEAKSHFSEIIAKSAFGHERFIITRRNKPVAVLVSLADLEILEQHEDRQGLASMVGQWNNFDEVAAVLDDLESFRQTGGSGRNVSL